MAKLPTAAQIDRPIPQARQSVASYTPQDGKGLEMMGKQLGAAAEDMQAQQDEIDAAHVGSEFTVAYANRLNALNGDQDYKTMPERYTKDMNATKEQLLSQVSNPRTRAKLSARLDGVITGGLDNVFAKQRQGQNDYIKADILRTGDDLAALATGAKTKPDFDMAVKSYTAKTQAAKSTGALDAVEQYNLDKKFKSDNAQKWYLSQPADKQLELLGRATTKNVSVIPTILKNELHSDGTVRVHSDGDGDAIGGINSEAYPMEFAQAKEILETDGQDAAKKYITDFYQKEIVDKNGIGGLAPAVQEVVADGLTNHWSGFQKELLGAAKGGATADELVAMRRKEYQRLANENPEKYGKNLAGWNSRLDSLATDGFAKTGEIFDYMDADAKQKIIAGKDSIVQKAIDSKMAENPSQFIADLGTGKYSNYLDAAQVEKYKGNAVALQERQARQAAEVRIATNAVYHQQEYDKIQEAVANSDPATAFKLVGDLRQNLEDSGQSTQFADDVRARLLKTNPYSEEEKAKISTDIYDRFSQLKEDTGLKKNKKGVTKFNQDKTSLEDLVHLQQDMMTAKLSGVKGMDALMKTLSPALMSMAKKEQGGDDDGWSFFGEAKEPYDKGYQVIQDYLVKQDKESDLPLKAGMMQNFIRQADNIPEEILKDPEKRDVELVRISNGIIAGAAQSGNTKNIPIAAIQYLRDHPETAEEFDKRSFTGAAAKILGK